MKFASELETDDVYCLLSSAKLMDAVGKGGDHHYQCHAPLI